MNAKLKGDEPGLVGCWMFDEETEGYIFDISPNENLGRLVGNTELVGYTRPIFAVAGAERLAEAVAAYEKALTLEPTSYELYYQLASWRGFMQRATDYQKLKLHTVEPWTRPLKITNTILRSEVSGNFIMTKSRRIKASPSLRA